jgi:uncharacterized membrane protein YkvA (DUF1232 family)
MSPLDSRCLEQFSAWLGSLSADARALCQLLEEGSVPELRRGAAIALNYLFKSIDLIPDGLEDLGYLDDAFVFRVAVARAAASGVRLEPGGVAERLAGDVALIREFMGADFERLESYVDGLGARAVRGRSIDDVLANSETRAGFLREVHDWASSFESPSFLRDTKSLVKLRSFFATRLAAAV